MMEEKKEGQISQLEPYYEGLEFKGRILSAIDLIESHSFYNVEFEDKEDTIYFHCLDTDLLIECSDFGKFPLLRIEEIYTYKHVISIPDAIEDLIHARAYYLAIAHEELNDDVLNDCLIDAYLELKKEERI
jgi:hypothetical protein